MELLLWKMQHKNVSFSKQTRKKSLLFTIKNPKTKNDYLEAISTWCCFLFKIYIVLLILLRIHYWSSTSQHDLTLKSGCINSLMPNCPTCWYLSAHCNFFLIVKCLEPNMVLMSPPLQRVMSLPVWFPLAFWCELGTKAASVADGLDCSWHLSVIKTTWSQGPLWEPKNYILSDLQYIDK